MPVTRITFDSHSNMADKELSHDALFAVDYFYKLFKKAK